MTGYTALAARVPRALESPQQQRLLKQLFGGLFVLAGALLALFHP
jgi:homoserine/homoserine lactone efflux protein